MTDQRWALRALALPSLLSECTVRSILRGGAQAIPYAPVGTKPYAVVGCAHICEDSATNISELVPFGYLYYTCPPNIHNKHRFVHVCYSTAVGGGGGMRDGTISVAVNTNTNCRYPERILQSIHRIGNLAARGSDRNGKLNVDC